MESSASEYKVVESQLVYKLPFEFSFLFFSLSFQI
jgi:hypothetical protein